MTPTFNEALAEHGSAKDAIRCALIEAHGENGWNGEPQWVLDNAAAIHQHQSESPKEKAEMLHRISSAIRDSEDRDRVLSIRLQALEDAPGPRPNAAEVSALRQRMDSLTELGTKLTALDTSDVLEQLVHDVALLKDWIVLTYTPDGYEKARQFRNTYIGTKPATPEARKMLGVGVQPEPKPTDKNVYGPDDYERAKQHIGKIGVFSDGGNKTTEPMRLLYVVKSNYPYATENGNWFSQFKLADPQHVATPEPEPVYEWVGNDYYFDGKAVGGISQIYNGRFSSICEGENFPRYDNTEAEARAWVEAQFNPPKQ